MIHSILLVFSLHVFSRFSTSPRPLWSSSGALCFILNAFLHPIIIFRSTCPYHRSLFCCNSNVMSFICYLSAPYLEIFYLNATDLSDPHLTIVNLITLALFIVYAFALHVIFPLIKPCNQPLFSFTYHCQVISIQQFPWQGNPECSRYGLHDNHE